MNNTKKHGVSSARNLGAKCASGDILFFVDSDILLRKNTLTELVYCYKTLNVDGVVGVLSEEVFFDGFYSQYKNLWMRYTYLMLEGMFPPFYSSVASIKKVAFEKTDGFLETYRKPGIEDTVFGNHLFERGYNIKLCPNVEVLHIKKYSFSPLVFTDFKRGAGLTRFFLGNSLFSFCSNLFALVTGKKKIITSVPLFFLFSFFLEFTIWNVSVWKLFRGEYLFSLYYFLFGWLVTNVSNYPWLIYLKNTKGIIFFIKAFLFIPVEVFLSISSGMLGILLRSKSE